MNSTTNHRNRFHVGIALWLGLYSLIGLAPLRAGEGTNYPCSANDSCTNHTTWSCASGPQMGKACFYNSQCSGHLCQANWQEYFVDAGTDMSCAADGCADGVDPCFGGAGADGVDLADFDGDGDVDIVTGWEETGITYIYRNPCNPSNPNNPTDCTNPGGVRQQWQSPWGTNPIDVRGGASTNFIEDAVFADFDGDGIQEGVATANEGKNKHVKIHGSTHVTNPFTHEKLWLGKELPGTEHLYMQVRVADINGDGCADVVSGNKIAHPEPCYPGTSPEDKCNVCDSVGATCDETGGIWWWECPKVDGVCAPFGTKFGDTPPEIHTGDWTKRRIDSGFYWIMGLDLVDMDGDGDKDVLYSDRFEIGWFENRTDEGNLAGWNAPIRIDTYDAIIARNDGTKFPSGEPFRFHTYGDVDGDDMKDVVVATSFSIGHCSESISTDCAVDGECPVGQTCIDSGSINSRRFSGYFYRRMSTDGRAWDRNPVFVKGGLPYGLDVEGDAVSKGVAIGDLTGDGQNELVFSVRGRGHALYMLSYDPAGPDQCGPCLNNEWNLRPISPCRTGSKYDNVQLADIDHDGRLDVVSSEENFQSDTVPGTSSGLGVVWYRNLGFCGNGSIESDEECDNGARNGLSNQCCAIDCTLNTGQICRGSSGFCESPEVCQSNSAECPLDVDKPVGTFCQSSPCDMVRHECDGAGSCIPAEKPIPCTVNSQCDSGLCLPGLNVCAGACDEDGNDCTHDICNAGVCQHPPKAPAVSCGAESEVCQVSQCDGNSQCVVHYSNAGNPCGENPTQPCDQYDECDGAGTCVEKIRPDGAICRFSRGDCDFDELCDGVHTSCPPDVFKIEGTVCREPPSQSCNQDESTCFGYCSQYQCNTNFDCQEVGIADGAICYDDGNECSEHRCTLTWCIREDIGSGTPCTDDGISCTDDWCNGIECIHVPNPNPDPCEDDGNPCTDDICDIFTGECAHVAVPGRACVDDGNECTENVCGDDGNCYPSVLDDTPCVDDGSVCTDDFCMSGICEHPPVTITTACDDDGNECTDDTCVAGACQHVPLVGQICMSDDNECTLDACNIDGLCTHSAVADLQLCNDDGLVCTKDHCIAGACLHPPQEAGLSCGNSSVSECDASDTCDGKGTCNTNYAEEDTPCTPDDIECTLDVCRSGVCVHAADLPLPPPNKKDPVEPLCGSHSLLPVGDPPNDVARAFAVFDDGNGEAIYAGGTMLHKWDGVSWTQIDLPGGIADTILAMDVVTNLPFGSGSTLYIGGSLVAPLNGPQPLLRWDGSTWLEVGLFNGPIHALEAFYDQLFVGGVFTSVDYRSIGGPVNGFVVNHIARLTQIDLEFDPPNIITTWQALGEGTDDVVYALSWGLYSCTGTFDRLGVGGAFTTAGGLTAPAFAYWNLNNDSWATVDPLLPPEGGTNPVVYSVNAIKSPFDFVRPLHIGGLFRVPEINSPTGYSNNAARLLGCGGNWYGMSGGGVTSDSLHAVRSIAPTVDQSGFAIFFGGEFDSFNDIVSPQIVRLGSSDWAYSVGSCINGSVEAMLAFDDGHGEALYVGGLFTNANGENYIARWRGLPGDLDGDGIVTSLDFTFNTDLTQGMKYCQQGPAQGAWGTCGCADLNKDNHVDLRDVAELMNRMGTTD